MLRRMAEILSEAARGAEGDHSGAVREALRLLTGGAIELYQQGESKAQRGWLQGRFRVAWLSCLMSQMGVANRDGPDDSGQMVSIDYRQASSLDREADQVKELYDQGLLNLQIAARLGCARNHVTRLLRHWFESHGLPMPDGRMRRAGLPRKQSQAPLYEQLAELAKAAWDEGLADVQIAARLGCSPPTAAAAVAFWHTSHGLEVPTHAARRAELVDGMHQQHTQGKQIREIAREVGLCSRTVTLLLRERFASLGQEMPDGRTRRRTQR